MCKITFEKECAGNQCGQRFNLKYEPPTSPILLVCGQWILRRVCACAQTRLKLRRSSKLWVPKYYVLAEIPYAYAWHTCLSGKIYEKTAFENGLQRLCEQKVPLSVCTLVIWNGNWVFVGAGIDTLVGRQVDAYLKCFVFSQTLMAIQKSNLAVHCCKSVLQWLEAFDSCVFVPSETVR